MSASYKDQQKRSQQDESLFAVISDDSPNLSAALPQEKQVTPIDRQDSRIGMDLENVMIATRQLESSLAQERARNRALRDELSEVRTTYDRLLNEANAKNRELSLQSEKWKADVEAHRKHEKGLVAERKAGELEIHHLKNELAQYKRAWADVLQREREAKEIISESKEVRKKSIELESYVQKQGDALQLEREKARQSERHAQSYQAELHSALIRLHSSETKFREIERELKAVNESKKIAGATPKKEIVDLRKQSQALKKALVSERRRVEILTQQLNEEAKKIYERLEPHRALVESKNADIARLRREMKAIPPGHPRESIVKVAIGEIELEIQKIEKNLSPAEAKIKRKERRSSRSKLRREAQEKIGPNSHENSDRNAEQ